MTNSPLRLIYLRLGLLLLGALVTYALLVVTGAGDSFPPDPLLSTMYFVVVNIICLVVIRRLLHKQGKTIREFIGFSKKRLLKDTGWGFVWLAVMYLPFVGALMLVMYAMFGADMFNNFEAVFASASPTQLPYLLNLFFAAILAFAFPIINAPVEEMYYRGWAQTGLMRKYGAVVAVTVQAFFFGVQHMLLAPSLTGVLAYGVMFFVWGFVAGLIYLRQKRLMPIIMAHFITNVALFSFTPLALLLMGEA